MGSNGVFRLLTVQECKDGLGLMIPKEFASIIGVVHGSKVEISVVQGSLIITPVKERKSLSELLEEVTDDNRHGEINFKSPMGSEYL